MTSGVRGFQILAILTTALTYLLIVIGGAVRATGSGLACPNWPTCNGNVIPNFNQHVLIEYTHRLTASAVSILVVLLALGAIWIWHVPRYLRVLSLAAVALLVVQVILGGVTVLSNLPPQIVTAHLATATLLLGVLTTVSVYALTGRAGRRDAETRRFARVAMIAAAGFFLVILSGSYVVGSDAGLACHTWPLCNGQFIPGGGEQQVDIVVLHRIVALLIGVVILVGAIYGWNRREKQPIAWWVAVGALALYVVQVVVGGANVWFGLASGIQIAHLAVAQALWMTTTALVVVASAAPGQDLAREPDIRRPARPVPSPDRRGRFGDRVRSSGGAPGGDGS